LKHVRGTGQILEDSRIYYYICVVCYLICALRPCGSRASRLRVRVSTTAFPGWSSVDSFSRLHVTAPLRPNDLYDLCVGWRPSAVYGF
jgi:hypothetical protein